MIGQDWASVLKNIDVADLNFEQSPRKCPTVSFLMLFLDKTKAADAQSTSSENRHVKIDLGNARP